MYGQQHRPRVRRSRPAAVHTGHAPAADAVVFGRCHERSVGRQRIELAQQQGAVDGNQRAGTGQTVQVHVRNGSRGGIRRVAATRYDVYCDTYVQNLFLIYICVRTLFCLFIAVVVVIEMPSFFFLFSIFKPLFSINTIRRFYYYCYLFFRHVSRAKYEIVRILSR